jgi:small subunit ribosomal protein S2
MAEETAVAPVATTPADTPVVLAEIEAAYFDTYDFSVSDTTLEGLLRAGVHFGHLKSRHHPQMETFIFTTRKNINILDLEKTSELLKSAGTFLAGVAKAGKPVLFAGVKKQTHDAVRSLAKRIGEPYVIDRWLGGTLTNFASIRKRVQYLKETEEKLATGAFKKYTKFEQMRKQEEVDKLERKMGGIRTLGDLPGAVVIADVREADIVVREARKMGVPIVGITDSNADPTMIDYPIPGNDDALSSVRLLLGYLGKCILEAKGQPLSPKAK